MLLVTPSADFFAEPHVDSLIGYAKVFHAAGIRWTLSSHASEAGNFGLFIGNYDQLQKIALRIREAALELGVKRIVVGECGHAWRVAYSFWNTLAGIGAGGDDPFARMLQSQLDSRYRQPMHICELTWDLIERGALTLDKEANDHRVVTFHDSCNVARASRMGDAPGGQFEIPRAIIRAVANKYVEMAPGTTREQTFCCGGGGGLLTDELLDLRVKGALPRMEALQQVADGARRQLHGDDLRDLQGAVHQGAAVLRIQDGHGRRRAPARQHGDPARRQALSGGPQPTDRSNDRRSGNVHDPQPDRREAHLPPLQGRRREVGLLARPDLPGELHAQVPDLHPVDAAVPGQLPVRRGHPRLPQHRARHREAAGGHERGRNTRGAG